VRTTGTGRRRCTPDVTLHDLVTLLQLLLAVLPKVGLSHVFYQTLDDTGLARLYILRARLRRKREDNHLCKLKAWAQLLEPSLATYAEQQSTKHVSVNA